MSHFAIITLTPPAGLSNQLPAQVVRARAALERLSPRERIQELRTGSGDWILFSGTGGNSPRQEQGSIGCLPVGKGFHDPTRGVRISPGELAKRFTISGNSCFSDLAPPAGGCLIREAEMGFTAFTDRYGLQHIFYHTSPEGAVAGSSALLVALVSGDQIDLDAFGVLGLLGHHLGEMCGFQKTRKLPAGAVIHLRAGGCQVEHSASSCGFPQRTSQNRNALVKEGVEILRKGVMACLAAFPEADLELSGGLDSRLILAAIPEAKRRELRAVTLGMAGSHDCVLAKRIAEHEGMTQHWVDLARLAALLPEEILPFIKSASLKTGYSANPFGRGVLEWVNSQIDQRPRLSGQNGEYIRGFYYPGQPDAASVSPHLVNSLARWRMWTNQGVDLSLFTPEYRERIQTYCLENLNLILRKYDTSWLLSTDEFYLNERMGRWVGMEYSAATLERDVLAPFFHAAFVDWARPIPPVFRRGSGLSAALIEALDPYLSSLPLDGGIAACDLVNPNLRVRLAGKIHFATKVAKKAMQRITGRGKPPSGTQTLYQSLILHHPKVLDLLPHVQQSVLLDPAVQEGLSTGRRQLESESLGFLLNLEWTYEFLESAGWDLSPLSSAVGPGETNQEGWGEIS